MKKLCTILFLFYITINLYSFPNNSKMDPKVGAVPKTITLLTFQNPKSNLPALVQSLTNSSNSDSAKIRVIHDWICNNIEYDTEMWLSGKRIDQDYISVLQKKKAVCSGYSSLFIEMCRLAGIKAIGIQGYSKGFGYSGKLKENPDHEWNAVKLGNTWKLIDCCWDAGYVDYKTFIKHYSTEWYMTPPAHFIYSHLPQDPTYQFLPEDEIRTKEQFIKEPYIKGRFFQYGFELTDEIPDYTTEIEGTADFTFKITKQGIQTTSNIQNKNSGQTIENITWIDRQGTNYTYEFDVPDKNEYKAHIFAKQKNTINYPDRFSIYDFENKILPEAEKLISEQPELTKTISKEDFELFKNSFKKVEENDTYYYIEDQLNPKQQNLVTVIFNKLKVPSGYLEPILDFNIKAKETYEGCSFNPKYPDTYADYNSTTNTRLISPKQRILKKGQKYKFEFSTTNYKNFGIFESKGLLPFHRNLETNNFEIEYTIPENVEKLVIYGTTNNHNYSGLISYIVE